MVRITSERERSGRLSGQPNGRRGVVIADTNRPRVRFALGRLVATPGALRECRERGINLLELVMRHARGDWGSVSVDDARENESSVEKGFRILSSYWLDADRRAKVWVITEGDRSSTCVLLPEEY